MKKILLVALAALALHAETTVIKNATIMTESGKGTIKGSILVRDGKIAEVGENVLVPAGATVIDAAGQWVFRASSTAIRTSRETAISTRAAFPCPPW
jgi:hypothetical protein